MQIRIAELRKIIREEFEKDTSILLEVKEDLKIDLNDQNTITSKWLLSIVSEIDEPEESENILLNALEDSGFSYDLINSDQFEALHDKMNELAAALAENGLIKITDGTQYSRVYTKDSKKNLSRIHELDHLLPYAERLCEILPVICNASIHFRHEDSERTWFDFNDVEFYEHEETDFSIPIQPVIVISIGDSPDADYNNDIVFFSMYNGNVLGRVPAVDGNDDSDIKKADEWLISQSRLDSYDDIDEILKEVINYLLEYNRNTQLKPDYNVDVDLD